MKEKIGLSRKAIGLIAASAVAVLTAVLVICLGFGGHYVSIAKSAHGEVNADKRRANANETVALTYTAEEGYELMEIFVNGEALEMLEFTMPDENVLVEARFAVAGSEKGFNERHAKDTPGAISYEAVYPTGETHNVSWDFIYEKDGLEASAWVEGENYNGNGVLLNLSREELGDNLELNYLPNKTYQIFVEYQQNEGTVEPQISLKKADKKGILQDADTKGIEAEIADWKEDGVTVGYQVKLNVSYSLLGYKGKEAAKDSLTLLAGNRAKILPDMMGDFWLEGEHNPENHLTYPRLIDDNTLRENIFLDMTEMELAAYRDMGYALDGIIDENEYKGTMLEDATDAHSIKVWAHLTKGRNIQLVMEVESNTGFDELVNAYPGLSQYLFAEMGFGDNDGQTCTMVKANMTGEVENALSVVTVEENEGNSKYKNKAVVEMWIPQEFISQNINPDIVRLSRFALFSGNLGEGSTPENIFLVARWADINNCNITVDGIKLESEVVPPEDEIYGMDGVINDGEYPGTLVLEYSDTHRVTVRGFLTHGKNIRLAVRIEAHTNPEEVVNEFPGLGKYLFMEAAFGDNNGETDCRYVKANVLGKAEWAASVVKTTDLKNYGEYRYSTDMEMWIPSYAITNNVDPDNVEITRLGFFAGNVTGNETPDNLFAVARWADINACLITEDGLMYKPQFDVPEEEAEGLDGVIEEDEYEGRTISAASDNYRISLQGYLTADKNVRLAMVFDSKLHPETLMNKYPWLSKFLFAELCLGHNSGNPEEQDEDDPLTFIKANVVGQAENCVSAVKYTKNSKDADYRYTTVVEMWIPEFCITNNKTPNEVPITRLGVFHDLDKEDKDANWMIAKWAGLNYCAVTKNGIKFKSLVEIPENEAAGFDGKISAGEYKGQKLSTESKNYKLSVQAYLTSGKNIRLGIEVESKHDIEKILNKYPGLSQYLFAEMGFGHNDGQKTTLVKGNVLGQAENADIEVKTTKTGNSARPYKTVIELWVPQSCISNNSTPDAVPFTRMGLFHELDKEDPNTNWLIARWANDGAGLNNCTITADGIKFGDIVKVTETLTGFDGTVSANEYKGETLTVESKTGNYKMSVQGMLTTDKNIRLGITVESKYAPEAILNDYPELSQYLFTELSLGENNGDEAATTKIKANVLGEAENAASVVKTTVQGGTGYTYKTEIELWIPKASITNNTGATVDENNVPLTRMGLFHTKDQALVDSSNPDAGKDGGIDWLVAGWAGLNNCTITADGIVMADDGETGTDTTVEIPESESDGFDGVVSEGEYQGATLESTTENYHTTIQGYLTDEKNVRLVLKVESDLAPETVVNKFGETISQPFFAEMGFGENTGNGDCTLVKANVLGKAENAAAIAKTTDKGANAEYRYETVIEVWVPKDSVTNNTNEDEVRISRLALFHDTKAYPDAGIDFVVAKWANINDCRVTATGIELDSTIKVPEAEKAGLNGEIAENEYPGTMISGKASNYEASVQGYLTSDKDVRLGIKIHSNTHPNDTANAYPGVGAKMFAELCLGNNEGDQGAQDGKDASIVLNMIKANVLGESENAVSTVNTVENAEGSTYKYTTTIEMYIPSASITNNTSPENVSISRLVFLNGNMGEGSTPDNLFLIANWADINECTVTSNGIAKQLSEHEKLLSDAGVDGTIGGEEYGGEVITSIAGDWNILGNTNYYMTVQGKLLDDDRNMKIAVKIDSNSNPTEDNLHVKVGVGNTYPSTEPVTVNVSGNSNAVIKTVENAEGSAYAYTTIIEMYVSKDMIKEETATEGYVCIPWVYLGANGLTDGGCRLVDRQADGSGPYGWKCLTVGGIKDTSKAEEEIQKEKEHEILLSDAGVDGTIGGEEYGGEVITSIAGDWNILGNTNYYMTVQGKLLDDDRNMKIAVKIDSNSNPTEDNLHVKVGVGNTYPSTEPVTVNVSGNPNAVIKTVENAEGSTYAYTTVIEMYVSASMIKEETATEGFVCIPWVYLGANGLTDGGCRLIDRQADGNGPYGWKCMTTDGIGDIPSTDDGSGDGSDDSEGGTEETEEQRLLREAGVDGEISESEYAGTTLTSISDTWNIIGSTDHYVTVQGRWVDTNKNIKIAIKVDSKNNLVDESFKVELGLGNNDASAFTTLISADAQGNTSGATAIIKTENYSGDSENYNYTTVIELYVPSSSIQNDTNDDLVHIPRIYLYKGTENFGRLIDRNGWHTAYNWAHIKSDGLYN